MCRQPGINRLAGLAGFALACPLVLFAAGCGVVQVAGAGAPPGMAANQAAARVAAARALSAAVLPPGAIPLGRHPGVPRGVRYAVGGAPASLQEVDAHDVWVVSRDPLRVFEWIRAHPPRGSTTLDWGSEGRYGRTTAWNVTFGLPAGAGVAEEGLGVDVTATKHGGSRIRADGWAIWQIPRPAWERVPAGVRAIAVFVDRVGGRTFPLSTVTASATVDQLVAFINSRQLQWGSRSCPLIQTLLDLRFLPAAGASPMARAVEDGCAGLRFSVGGRLGPELAEDKDLGAMLWRLRALPVCAAPQLHATASLPTRFPGPPALVMNVAFHNVSSNACTLMGSPRIELHDTRGRLVPTRVINGINTPEVVILTPGTSATVGLEWNLPTQSCNARRATLIDLLLPRAPETFRVRVGSDSHPFAPCKGTVRVEPIAYGP